MRKTLFWMHLSAATTAGLVIFVMALTGVLLAFERQVVAWSERHIRSTPTAAEPLPASALLRAAKGAAATGITLRSDRSAPAVITVGPDRFLFIDRYDATVLGGGSTTVRRFFRRNRELHRWLALEGKGREVGRAITGAANLVFLFIVLSGLFLWIPRSRTALRNITWFRSGLRGKARDFNWHNTLGLWAFLPLVAMVFSGVVISYPWATALVYRAFGNAPPVSEPRRPESRDAAGPRIDETALDRAWNTAIAEANRVAPDWKTLTVRLPLAGKTASFALDEGNGARPDKRSTLVVDWRDGRLVKHETYISQLPGRRARSWLRWIHTGEAVGVGGQIVAAAASAAAVLLVWTGISLALRRFRAWIERTFVKINQEEIEIS